MTRNEESPCVGEKVAGRERPVAQQLSRRPLGEALVPSPAENLPAIHPADLEPQRILEVRLISLWGSAAPAGAVDQLDANEVGGVL